MYLKRSNTVNTKIILALFLLCLFSSIAYPQSSEIERIAELNRRLREQGEYWTAGITPVSGLSFEEKKRLCGAIPPPSGMLRGLPVIAAPEDALFDPVFDWRELDGTTPAKNQGNCGSCWAFAAVGQLEAHTRIYDERLEDLSEQQVLSCNSAGSGCGGGWASEAYEVFMDPGSVLESCMPYNPGLNPPCTQDECFVHARISGYSWVSSNVNSIKQALLTGPVWATMVVYENFYDYQSGCYREGTTIVGYHAVLIVGWDDTKCGSVGSWIIKNSWGSGWGMDGYCYIQYGGSDIGQSTFQVDYIPSTVFVRVDSPSGGEILNAGEGHDITWITQRENPDSLSILLSIDSGTNYDHTVATGLVGTTSYSWTVPELPVRTARIKVIAYFNGDIGGFDTSDEDFTIKGKPYRYVSPSGGNVYPYSLPQWAAVNIQDAIDAADPGDSVIVAGSSYNYSVVVENSVYLMGGWNSDFTELNPETYLTTISSTGSPVSFMYTGIEPCGIEGFTITGGSGTFASLPNYAIYGGGIFCYKSSPIIKGNRITDCGIAGVIGFSAGGGICCYDCNATIQNNEISGCSSQSGGGIYLYMSNAAVRGNFITGSAPNEAYNGTKFGGGIYALHSSISLNSNMIHDNDGYVDGGGVCLIHSPATSSEDTISSNDCGGKGGGICSNHSPLSVTNAVIRENTSSSIGGGIFHSSNNLIVKNAIVALNDAVILGGGIYADSSWGEIIFNTIDRNGSGYAGGNVFLGQSISFDVRNNLVTYGLQNGFETNVPGNIDFQFNNCFGNFPLNVSTVIPDSTNSSRNPHYADTTSLDYHLLVHSGGIDTGDPSGITDPDGSRPDQGAYGGPDAIMAAPEYVKNLSAVAVNDTAVQLEWESVLPGYLSFFAIYCDQADGFLPDESNFIGMAAPGENTFLHQPVAGCMYYRVSAVNILGYGGGYSNQGTACASGPDLVAPEVTVIYPNGGETCSDGDTIYIEWTASDNRSVDSLSIFYSVNGGTDFMLLASGEPNDSLYMWIVPLTPSDSCIVKVVAYDPGLRIGQDESDGFFTIHHLTRADDTPAFVNALEQNYPNPFNGTTTIAYSVAERCRVELCVYDAAGHLVRVLEHRIREPGHYSTVWRGRDDKGRSVSSAVYFCRIKAGSFRQTKKIIYLR